MNPISLTSHESSKRTKFLERIAVRSGGSILIALAALELSVAVTFMAGGAITEYHFLLFVAVLLATCVYRNRLEIKPLWRVSAASLVLSLLVVFASFVLAGSTLDLSPDGQSAQMLRISHLASGWNPVYDAEFIDQPDGYILAAAETRFVDSGLGPHMAAASAVKFLGNIEYGKGFNLVLMGAVILLALAATLGLSLHLRIAVVLAIVAALNPVSVVQSLTTYVDGQVGALIACLVFLTMILLRQPTVLATAAWVATLGLLVNAKITGIAFALIIGTSALVFLLWKGFPPRLGFASFFTGLILGIGVIGFNGYVLEFVRHGRILGARDLDLAANLRLVIVAVAIALIALAAHWLFHKLEAQGHSIHKLQIVSIGLVTTFFVILLVIGGLIDGVPSFMKMATIVESDDPGLLVQPSGKITRALSSIFSESGVMPACCDGGTDPTSYRIKIPFQVQSMEFSSFRHLNPDHRAGGFGPWMSGAFMISCVVLLLMWIQKSKSRSDLRFWLAVILATVLLFPEPWWARLVPQAWLIPLLIVAYGCQPTNRRVTQRLAQILLLIVSVNAGMVLYEHARGQIAIQSAMNRTMLALQKLPQPVPVYFSNFHAAVFRFRDYGVEYVDTPASNCPRYLKMLRSPVRVCAGPAGRNDAIPNQINVRWIPEITRGQRSSVEQLLGLDSGQFVEGTTWTYDLLNPTQDSLQAIIANQFVEDTHGFSRETLTSVGPDWQEVLAEAQAIDSNLMEAGITDFRVVQPDPRDRIELLEANVQVLLEDGKIIPEQGEELIRDLRSAIRFFDRAEDANAMENLNAFAQRVLSLMGAGSLSTNIAMELVNSISETGIPVDNSFAGFSISLDASNLNYSGLAVNGTNGSTRLTGPVGVMLIPGDHRVTLTNGLGPEAAFDFTVEADGTLQFDPSLDSLIDGRGTRDMVLRGTPVNIDPSALSYNKIDLAGAGNLTGATGPVPLMLMPGNHRFRLATGGNPEPAFDFTVEADGTLQFDPSLDSLIGGRGANDMMLHGTRISIDARSLTAPFAVEGLTINPVEQILIANFMPGAHRLQSSEINFVFTVTPDLTVDYGTELDEGVSGRGTATLIVNGRESGLGPVKMVMGTALGHALGRASRLIHLRHVIPNERLPRDFWFAPTCSYC